MRTSRDWRPQSIDVNKIARDAQLDRIEAKLDELLGHVIREELKNICNICGQTIRGKING